MSRIQRAIIIGWLVLAVLPLLNNISIVHAQRDELSLPDEALLTDPVFAQPGFAGLASTFAGRTRYLLALDIDQVNRQLIGKARVLFVNRTPVLLNDIVFRLYPNHPVHAGRQMNISNVQVNGSAVQGEFMDQSATIYRLPLATPLGIGGQVAIDFAYTITLPNSNLYYISEPYPIVAVYDASGWRTDVATNGLDYAYNESALHVVKLRAPTYKNTWFIGAVRHTEQSFDGQNTTYTIVTGPVRNFIVVQADGWRTMDFSGASVPIRMLYATSDATAQKIGEIAVAAFNFYEANFGAYPYAEFDLIVMNFPSGGEEYPSLVFINQQRGVAYWHFIVAHEVAHQWFYGIAGNDIFNHAWLDESAVQVAGYLFYKRTGYGATDVPNPAEQYWQSILTWYNRRQTPRLLNTPMQGYQSFADYMSNIYGGGAVFLRTLGETIGDDALITGMRAYVQTVGLGVGTPEQFYAAVQAQTSTDLRPMFCQQVGIMC